MNIVFATSDLYSKPALITIKSLLMNNKTVKDLTIYYIENGIEDNNKNAIADLVNSYGRNIIFISMPKELLEIKGLMRTNPVVYSYCFFQDILPTSVEKVILLEGDSLVIDDISEMYDIDLDGYYLGATDDLQSKWYKKKLGMKDTSPYFNCGIMVLNLKKWREDNISRKAKEMIENGKTKFFYEVQDELNVLMEGHVKILPPKFNCTTSVFLFDYEIMKIYRKPSTCCSKEDFDYARKHPSIIHFTSNQIIQSRPWIEGCVHPYKEYYENIKSNTSLSSMKLWKNKLKISNKIAYKLYASGHKKLLARTLGIVHSYLYPMYLYRFILR